MSAQQAALLAIKGAIYDLPPEDQAKVKSAAEQIKAVVAENGGAGAVALSLVAVEMAVDA